MIAKRKPGLLFIVGFVSTWVMVAAVFGPWGVFFGFIPAYGGGIFFDVIEGN